MWILLARLAVAHAHPVSDGMAAQSTAIVVHRDRVDVDYYADVPELLVRTARPGATDPAVVLAAMLTELRAGIVLTVDGRQVPLQERSASPAPAPSSEHTLGFALHLQAPLPARVERIEVATANLIDARSVFAGDVRVGPGIVVRACSLLPTRPDGAIGRDDTLRWTRGEDRRLLSVTLGPPRPRWWPTVAGEPTEPRRAALALAGRPRDVLRAGRVTPATLAASGAVALGLGWMRTPGRWAGWAWAAAGAAGIGLAAAPGWAAVEAGAAAAVLAVAVGAATWAPARPWAAAVAVGALGAATHAPMAAIIVVGCGAIGAIAARGRSRAPDRGNPGPGAARAAGIAVALAIRALG